ncbi:MAG: hypothetical protein AAF646_02385 [Pseudomonadota bacterium]
MEEFLQKWGSYLVSAAVGLLWLGRLEWRSRQNGKEIEEGIRREEQARREALANERDARMQLEARLREQRSEDLDNRRRDLEQISGRLDGISTDVKVLLQRTSKG